MEFQLYRPTRPEPEENGFWMIGLMDTTPVYMDPGPPREIVYDEAEAAPVTMDDIRIEMSRAGGELWGPNWRRHLEDCTGMRPGALRKSLNRDQLPPPAILAWLAWIAGLTMKPEEKRALGHAMMLKTLTESHVPNILDKAERALGLLNR